MQFFQVAVGGNHAHQQPCIPTHGHISATCFSRHARFAARTWSFWCKGGPEVENLRLVMSSVCVWFRLRMFLFVSYLCVRPCVVLYWFGYGCFISWQYRQLSTHSKITHQQGTGKTLVFFLRLLCLYWKVKYNFKEGLFWMTNLHLYLYCSLLNKYKLKITNTKLK